MKVEWWYNDPVLHYSDDTTLALARLTVADGGSAEVLTDGGEVLGFSDEDAASLWLVDEEYRRLEDLIEDLREDGRPIDPRIKAPAPLPGQNLVEQMVINLAPQSPAIPLDPPGTLPSRV